MRNLRVVTLMFHPLTPPLCLCKKKYAERRLTGFMLVALIRTKLLTMRNQVVNK